MVSGAGRIGRWIGRAVMAGGLVATSQLSACLSTGGYFSGGEQYQYQGGPGPSPGGNFNPVSGTANSGNGGND